MAERIPLRRSSTTPSRLSEHDQNDPRSSNPDIFSDDFALEELGIADGFRPSSTTDDHHRLAETSTRRTDSRRSVASQQYPEITTNILRRSVGSQKSRERNADALRHDTLVPLQTPRRTPSVLSVSDMSEGPFASRPMSTVSTLSMPRTQSLYRGATGPSHPYGMYPQNIAMVRSPSMMTASTGRVPEIPYAGANTPIHPYAMYPQTTVHDGEVSPIAGASQLIPVGFPGLDQQYSRRLGPEGEDADDIIGPNGHTEQLPPYTRYQDNSPSKESVVETGAGDESDPFRSPVQPTHSHTFGVRSFTSEDEAPQVSIPVVTVAGSSYEYTSSSAKEKWAAKGKKRIWGGKLPVWALILIVVLLVLLGGLLGGVVGRVSAHRHGFHNIPSSSMPPDSELQSTTTATASTVFATITATMIDARPLASPPPNLPSLPLGSYGIPISNPSVSSDSCLGTSPQNVAWECITIGYLGLNVTPEDYGPTQASLFGIPELGLPGIKYGAQPPVLGSACDLTLVNDTEYSGQGPAYFFQQMYNKTVVINEDEFTPSGSKRSLHDSVEGIVLDKRYGTTDEFAAIGHKPWFCFWNSTVLEGFIYVTQNTSTASSNMTAIVDTMSGSTVSSLISSSPIIASSTSASDNSATMAPPYAKRDGSWPTALPSPYPKVIKIEERRSSSNSVSPYCQQMQIALDGSVVPILDAMGMAQIMKLNETEVPPPQSERYDGYGGGGGWRGRGRHWSKKRVLAHTRRQAAGDSCRCEWLSA